MKNSPKIVGISITVTTVLLVFYTLSPFLGFSYSFVVTLFLILPIFVIWMVYTIIRHGVDSGRTFDDQWYDDFDQNQ